MANCDSREKDLETLVSFLRLPHTPQAVLERFEKLDGAVSRRGQDGDHAFVYVPATRPDGAVLLVAHADVAVEQPGAASLRIVNGVLLFNSSKEVEVLGADDRAGCAILWALRETGHGLLVLSGEEKGSLGAHFLVDEHPALAAEINRKYGFLVEFDKAEAGIYATYNVGTPEFEEYVEAQTGFSRALWQTRTDICTLCREACGVNLSIGYNYEHHSNEQIDVAEWCRTLEVAREWLGRPNLPVWRR